jgi:hypothetical protein
VVRYLSLDWLDALTVQVTSSDDLRAAAEGRTLGVTQVVTDGPEGDVVYHLQVADGQATFGPGRAEPEDVCFTQDWETAVGVATGTINAQDAFVHGRVRFHGDPQLLLDNQPVFKALDRVFTTVREQTDYR